MKPSDQSVEHEMRFDFFEFYENLKNEFSHLPPKKRDEKISSISREYYKNKELFDQVFYSLQAVKEIVGIANKHFNSPQNYLPRTLVSPSPLKVLSLLALFMAVPAVAQQTTRFFAPHAGQAPGGEDLCSGALLGCAQGYTTEGNATFNSVSDSQYSRVLNSAHSDADSGAREQLRTCFDIDALGSLVVNSRNKVGTSQGLQTCTASSTPWEGWVIDVTTTKIPQDQCFSLQNDISAALNKCKSITGAWLNGAKIAGIILGSVAALALIVAGSYFVYKKSASMCARNEENQLNLRV